MKKRILQALPLLLIFAIYLAFAGYQLRWLPSEWFGDISIVHRQVMRILAGGLPWRYDESAGPAYHYLVAAFAFWLGPTFWAYKLASLFTGLIGVGMVYLLGRELAGKRVGLLAALVAALSTWLIIFARMGSSPQIFTPVLSAGSVYFLLRFAEDQDWLNIMLSMILAGLGLFTYPAIFILPGVVLALIGWQILFDPSRKRWGLALALALFTLVPFVLWFIRLAETTPVFQAGGYVGEKLFGHGQPLGATLLTFGKNMLLTLGMFQWVGDHAFRTNVSGKPILDPLSGVLLDLGLVWLLLNPRLRPRWVYLIAPILILLVPSADPALPHMEIPSASRGLAAAPFIFILIALGLDAVWIFVTRLFAAGRLFLAEARARLPGETFRQRWSHLQLWIAGLGRVGPVRIDTASGMPCRKDVWVAGLVLLALLGPMAWLNLNRYFGAYAWGLPEHNQPWGLQIAQVIDAQPPNTIVKMGACCWGDWGDPDPESIYYVLQHPEFRPYFLKDSYARQCSDLQPGQSYLLIFPPEPDAPRVTLFTTCFPDAVGKLYYDAMGQKAFYTLNLTVP